MQKNERFTARKLAIVGLLSALVFVSSWMQIEVGPARFHLGNGFCALAGLSAGFGSMLFDLTNPAYISGCLITFVTKFVIGYLAGLIAHKGKISTKKDILGTLAGSIAYIVLYMAKSFVEMYWIEGQAMGAVQVRLAAKFSASCVNAAVALVVATLLAAALRPALRRAKILAA